MDDSIEINLRPRRQIAHRLLIQVALTNRAGLESLDRYTAEDEEARFDLVAWLIDARAVDELTRSGDCGQTTSTVWCFHWKPLTRSPGHSI